MTGARRGGRGGAGGRRAHGRGRGGLQVGRARRVVMTMAVFSGVYRAVAGSDLIALLPTQLAEHIAPHAGIDVFRPPMPIEPAQICMIWHRRNTASPAHSWLRDQIVDLMAPLDEGPELPAP